MKWLALGIFIFHIMFVCWNYFGGIYVVGSGFLFLKLEIVTIICMALMVRLVWFLEGKLRGD